MSGKYLRAKACGQELALVEKEKAKFRRAARGLHKNSANRIIILKFAGLVSKGSVLSTKFSTIVCKT